MHFLYIVETANIGHDLLNTELTIFVVGGLMFSDEKRNPTQQKFIRIISVCFGVNGHAKRTTV